jgi:hypothetical protein
MAGKQVSTKSREMADYGAKITSLDGHLMALQITEGEIR